MVSIYKRKGRKGYTVQWLEPDTRRFRTTTRRTKELAIAEKERLERAALASAGMALDRTLTEYSASWLKTIAPTLRAGTVRVYTWALEWHILPALGLFHLRAISRAVVKDFIAALLGAGLKKKTVSNIKGTLHAILAEAVQDGILATNPAAIEGKSRLLRLTPTRAERRAKVKAMEADQARRFIAATYDVPAPRGLRLRLMLFAGLRAGEGLGVQWGDIDWVRRQLTVRRSIVEGHIEPTKSGHERDVDLGARLVAELRAWDVESKRLALASGTPRPEWIFPGDATLGTGTSGHLRVDVRRVLRKAGLPHFTPHSLRHTFASLHLTRGRSIYYVQRQLGHASITMTVDLYGSWLPAGNREHADAFEEELLGGSVLAVTGGHDGPEGRPAEEVP